MRCGTTNVRGSCPERAAPLRSALRVLDEVRGSGAVIPALLTGLRVARHLDAVEVAGDYSARLQAAARAKGDDRLLLTVTTGRYR